MDCPKTDETLICPNAFGAAWKALHETRKKWVVVILDEDTPEGVRIFTSAGAPETEWDLANLHRVFSYLSGNE